MQMVEPGAGNSLVSSSDISAAAGRTERLLIVVLLSLILLSLGLKFSLWFRFPINQDEFAYLSKIHAHARGELAMAFQTLHVHPFFWLPAIGESEVVQMMAARAVMSGFFLGTCIWLYLLARHWLDRPGALFSVLCYISLLYVLYNGASFRSDTPAAFFSMFAVYLFVRRERSWGANVLAGISIAVACLFTIKAALYLALFLPLSLVTLWSSRFSRASLKRIGSCAAAFAAGLSISYVLHTLTLAAAVPQPPGAVVAGAASSFLTLDHLFPGLRYFMGTLFADWTIWLVLAVGLLLSLSDLRGKRQQRTTSSASLPIMSIPLLSLLFYRNTYPYYYAFMMPPVVLFCGYTLRRLLSATSPQKRWLPAALSAALAILIAQNSLTFHQRLSAAKASRVTVTQRSVLAEIHKMFPKPVPYLDGCSMVASYPQVGFFMSTAGMKGYLRTGRPNLESVLADRRPLFLLANIPHLDLNSDEPPASSAGLTLRDDDWLALRSNFIHHWGPVWVIGKQFDAASENLREDFDVLISGLYTVEAETEILIDGRPFRPGDVVELSAGTHLIEAGEAAGTIRLRWGDRLYRPRQQPPSEPLFLGIFG